MSKKWYIVIIAVSLVLLIGVINLLRVPNDNSNDNNNNTKSENVNYSKKEKESAEKRQETQTKVEENLENYIFKYYAPKNQKDYDEAIAMRNSDDEKDLKKDVEKEVKDKDRNVTDIYINTDYSSPKTITGTYEFVLNSKDNKTENKSGEFELKTNSNGYFYIDKFN